MANYSLGYQLGRDLATLERLGTPPDLGVILKGISDGLAGAEPGAGAQAMNQALSDLRQRGADQAAETKGARFEARTTSAFNALQAGRDGLVTLPNGLQYRILTAGNGRQPKEEDTLTINYKATLPNGVLVDSTYDDGEPATLKLGEIEVPGLKQALALMSSGAKWEVFVPPALGFSEYSTLRDRAMIYELELLDVASPQATGAASSPP